MGAVTPGAGRVLVGALVMLLAAACGRGDAAARNGGSGPYAKEVAEAIPMIERGTGLTFKHPPNVETRTKAQVRLFLEQRFREDVSDSEMTGQQVLYRRLGLIPDTLDLRRLMLDLLTEQVAGFYDPKTKTLYIVDGAPRETLGFVVQHELVHALQDQYANLDSLQHLSGNDDRAMAAQAVLEGQAMLVPLQAAAGGNPGALNLPGMWDRVRDQIRQEQAARMPVFSSAPLVIQESLLFPYLSGTEFMQRFVRERPTEQPFGANMPTSTEQIVQPQAYFGAHRDAPITVELPAPRGASTIYANDLGEFQTRLFVFANLNDQPRAVRAAAGWGGDRYQVLRTPKGDGLAWLTVWDTPVDAAEFGAALQDIIQRRFGNPPTPAESDAGRVWHVKGRTLRVWGGSVAGKAAVLYVDVPEGVDPDVLDLNKVRLR